MSRKAWTLSLRISWMLPSSRLPRGPGGSRPSTVETISLRPDARPSVTSCLPPLTQSEQPQHVRLDAPERVVVDLHAVDAPLAGEHPRLRLELQRHQHPPHLLQPRPHPHQVARELLDAVDLAAALDLDRHVATLRVAAQQVDRADVGRVLQRHQAEARADGVAAFGEQGLEVLLDAVLDQARVQAE